MAEKEEAIMTETKSEEMTKEPMATTKNNTNNNNNSNKDSNNINNTMSTKMSTDQLICKTPRESPANSVKSLEKNDGSNYLLFLGALQLLFGFFMVVFGILVILNEASLAHVGGGLWGGALAMSTGVLGILAAAKDWCPLKTTPQRMAHTAFLALSLVSLAISQLIVALAATGLGRDLNSSEFQDDKDSFQETSQLPPGHVAIALPNNYARVLSNVGLLLVATVECILAAISSYKSSRMLCPCFRGDHDYPEMDNRNALVNSWLGRHSPVSGAPQIYLVAAPASSLGKGSKLSGGLSMPIFAIPPPPNGQMMGYPLIPAPLGTIPSPIIPPPHHMVHGRCHRRHYSRSAFPEHGMKSSKSRNMSKSMDAMKQSDNTAQMPFSTEDIAKTYTGLDKVIAEEFIDICDSRNASLCSDSSCTSSGCNTNSDVASRDYLVNTKL